MRSRRGRDRHRRVRRALHAASERTAGNVLNATPAPRVWLLTFAVTAPALVVAAVLAARLPGPSLLWDGQGYLGAARWAARDRWPLLGELAFYHPSYGALLAPSIWFGASPMGLFRWAQAVNVASIAVTALAVGALARTLLPEPRRWLAATAAACAYPPLVVQAGFEWPEVPISAAFAVAALLAWRERWLGLAFATVALYALHPRGLGVVVVTAVLLAALRRWPPLAVLGAGVAAVQLVNRLALDALYNPGRSSAAGGAIDVLTDPGEWPDVATKAIGSAWYLVVATAGLSVVAILGLARERRPGARWLLGATVALLGASAIQLAGASRADHAVYGRYLDLVAPVLVVFAARHLRARAFVVAIASLVVFAIGVELVNPADALDGTIAFVNVPVLAVLGGIDIASATAAAVVAALIVAVVASRSPVVALAFVAVAGLATAVAAHDAELRPFATDAASTYTMGQDVHRFAVDGIVALDVEAYDMLAVNRYQWQFPDVTLPYWRGGALPSPAIVSRKGPPPVRGARIAAIEPKRDLAVWVAPGTLQDELAAKGWLVADAGVRVTEAFYDARVEMVAPTTVRLTHAGGGAPWVPDGMLAGDVGLVRVLADGAPIALPHLVRPGETVLVEIPAGTSRVELEHVHHRVFASITIATAVE